MSVECTDESHDDFRQQVSAMYHPLWPDIPEVPPLPAPIAEEPLILMGRHRNIPNTDQQLEYDSNSVTVHPRPPGIQEDVVNHRTPRQDGDHGHLEPSIDLLNCIITLRQ